MTRPLYLERLLVLYSANVLEILFGSQKHSNFRAGSAKRKQSLKALALIRKAKRFQLRLVNKKIPDHQLEVTYPISIGKLWKKNAVRNSVQTKKINVPDFFLIGPS